MEKTESKNPKRYFWLKLQSTYFSQLEQKKMKRQDHGKDMQIVYLRMMLFSIDKGGYIYYQGVYDSLEEELAEEFDESVEIVKETLDYLKENNMISINENLDCFIPEVLDHTGSECYSAERMRRHRANKRVSHCDTDVTKSDSCVTGSDEEKELELERELDKESDKDICSEPETVSEPSGIKITLNDKSFYDVPVEKIAFWKEVYPAVDVEQELRKMIAWCDANPTRRKTKRGIEKFINGWLSREQDKGGKYRNGKPEEQKTEFELPEYLKNLNQDPDPEIDKLWGG